MMCLYTAYHIDDLDRHYAIIRSGGKKARGKHSFLQVLQAF